MTNFINGILAKPLAWIAGWTGNYALSILLYLVIVRLLFVFFDYIKADAKVKTMLAKPFVSKIKEKYLGKDSSRFEGATLEVFNVTKTSQFTKMLPILIEYPLIIAIFYALYHPVSILFPSLSGGIETLSKIASTVSDGTLAELNIVHAVKSNAAAFAGCGYDISGIADMKIHLFGKIDLFSSASFHSWSIALPVLLICFFAWSIIKMLIPVFKKKQSFKKILPMVSIMSVLYALVGISSFSLPMVFFLYFMVFSGIGIVSGKIIDKWIIKKRKQWVLDTNCACQEILRKYGIEDEVSAVSNSEKGGKDHEQTTV